MHNKGFEDKKLVPMAGIEKLESFYKKDVEDGNNNVQSIYESNILPEELKREW